MATNIIAGCVADNNEKYLLQALRLLQSWRWFAGDFASAEFIVAVVDRIDPYYQAQYERYAATVVAVPRFCKIHQPSNKLRFLELPQVNGKDAVLLLDCDTLVVREPMGLFTIADLTAKISDVPTVSACGFFRHIFLFWPAFTRGESTLHDPWRGDYTLFQFGGVSIFSGCHQNSCSRMDSTESGTSQSYPTFAESFQLL